MTSSGLGASSVVAACGSGIQASYTTTFASAIPGYSVSASGAAVGSEMSGTLAASATTA